MSAHTPGPWTEVGRYIETDECTICEMFSARTREERDANQRLIAAAPELLEALRTALDASWNGPMPDYARDQARAAIDAALAEPVHPGYIIGSHWLETAYSRIAAGEAEADVLAEVLGERGWIKPVPATDAEIVNTAADCAQDPEYLLDFRDGWQAAERFHGIRKEDK